MAKRCRNISCKKLFEPFNSLQNTCSTSCAIEYSKTDKGRKHRDKAFRRETRERRVKLRKNDRPYQFKLTKKTAQRLANLLDKDLPCICCDTPRGRVQFCGGHYKTAGGHPELALDLRNIHGQANQLCNMRKSANISGDKHSYGYTEGLIRRYGQDIVDYLNGYHPTKKYTCVDLIEIRKVYNAEIRAIKRGGQPTKNWRDCSL